MQIRSIKSQYRIRDLVVFLLNGTNENDDIKLTRTALYFKGFLGRIFEKIEEISKQ